MHTTSLSSSAYQLRQQWEIQDADKFVEFSKDPEAMQVINALAEMLVDYQTRGFNAFQL